MKKLVLILASGLVMGMIVAKIMPVWPASVPIKLEIPKLGIAAPVEEVRLDADGRMGTPENWNHAGWYALGTVPGQVGNAVMDGHYDSPTGPALFTHLDALQAGDDVYVVTAAGQRLRFRVTAKQVYRDEDFPVSQIFGTGRSKNLNLITCQGVFDRLSQNYSHRVVIFTELFE